MTRRRIAITLHWLVFILILAMVKGGTATQWVLWLFVGAVALLPGIPLSFAMLGRPGPKLSPTLHRAYPSMHRTLCTLLALTAIVILVRLIGQPLWWLAAWVTLGAGTFQRGFHFWRHTVLYDNALGLMTPRVMYKWL